MPFGEDILDGDLSPPLVQSDLIGGSVEPESPVGQGSAPGRGLTVVTLDDQAGMNGSAAPAPEAELDIDAKDEAEVTSTAPAPPSTIKKRGRPSLSGPATPAKSVSSKTPTSTNSAAAPKSAGRSTGKRKAAESEPELKEAETTPARKRGRPARSAGSSASARLAAKAANKPTRGRPKSAAQPAPKPAKKSGRAKKVTTNDEVPAGEYEVEEIVDSAIDADTLEHMYLVKWYVKSELFFFQRWFRVPFSCSPESSFAPGLLAMSRFME
ncbi:uncharacterized protein THITE_2121185 [Thermothielavioides terrestris NRRL 8126]|uniref:Chromo domain-containing protein n=1 Tax=Thermothielavioides terrestris (strain ATCC 38088 / NRRL 8126) TaxID=578455 RepID=G2REM5_THETT|nr:uncharacterized protein THITE_2121185 [Thermothielavioides terrestris NRRL 8126]AEO70158.1 hypothetical protein THITE_2121185 [Thermothielavioides terrestris NRRL 8126]